MKPGTLWIGLLMVVFLLGSMFGAQEVVQRRHFTSVRRQVEELLGDFAERARFLHDAGELRPARADETPSVQYLVLVGALDPAEKVYRWSVDRGPAPGFLGLTGDHTLVEVEVQSVRNGILLSTTLQVTFASGARWSAPGQLFEQMLTERGLGASINEVR